MKILIDNGYGLITAGKITHDDLFRKAFHNRKITRILVTDLLYEILSEELLVPGAKELPLLERVRRIKEVYLRMCQKNVIVVSIYVNAAGNGTKWLNATGWSVFTC